MILGDALMQIKKFSYLLKQHEQPSESEPNSAENEAAFGNVPE